MMETNFTFPKLLTKLLTVLLIGIISGIQVNAQSCACKQSIQASLDASGQMTITAEMLLADANTCAGNKIVTVMTTPTGNPIPTNPVVNCSHAGKTLYGKVSNGANSCWTTILVEDKVKPVISCPTGPLVRSCVQMGTFTPTVIEACGPVKLDTIAETITNCADLVGASPNILKRIVRTYQATDGSGNVSAPCTITFDVTVADLASIVYPPNYDIAPTPGTLDALVCDGNYAKLANGNPSPQNVNVGTIIAPNILPGTGVPTLDGVSLFNNPDLYCGLMVSYTDGLPQTIKCTTKIMRTWQVIEWSCLNRPPVTRVQVLEIVDNKGPQISGLTDISASTTDHNCEGRVTFANPVLGDNCSSADKLTADITIYPDGDYTKPGAFIKHGSSKTIFLPVGNHKAIYTAYDACYNKTTDTISVNIEDNTPPVAICDEFATVGLTNQGVAWVPASVFDDGSYDECKLEKFLVRRMNPAACGTCETPTLPGFDFMGEYGTGNDKKYYYLSKHTSSPEVAFKMAKAMGGNVITITSPAMDAWVWNKFLELTPGTGAGNWTDLIIGLTRNNNNAYTWQSGSNAGYRNFGSNPTGKYIVKYHDDNGLWYSYDPIYKAKYAIEITDPCGWSSYAKFCCSDVIRNQMVAFRAIDASGNYNECMVSAIVQDKIGPTITCPADRTVDCDFAYDPNNLRKDFGWPTATDNCENPTITRIDSVSTVNSCRTGTITRRFLVTDAGGRTASCAQVITFRALRPYAGPTPSQWPRDTMVIGCGDPASPALLPAALGSPILTDGACSLVGPQHTDEVYTFNQPNSPACFKILRKWTVIDWCQPLTSGGYRTWTHTQEIKVIDNIAPVVAPLAPVVNADTFDATCQSGQITLTASATDVCTAVLRSSYKIDAGNNGSFDITSSVFNNNTINASGVYPVGNHRIVYTFEDKCGNITSREQLFRIVNRKAPNPVVLQGLAISLMKVDEDEGMAEIWATDFDPNQKSVHPCGYPVLLSFSEVVVNALGQMVGTPNLVFDCANLGQQDVTIWVAALTPAGDVVQTSVNTFIDVQDNNDICPDTGTRLSVNGVIATESNQTLEESNVLLKGSELNRMTNKDGFFDFNNMPGGGTYTVIPEKNDDHLNGVSTLDLVMIQRHILGLEKLASPYKMIASDINKDGKVTAVDLVELRKLILGSIDNFSNNNSWRFVEKAYQFADLQNAQGEAFPESYYIDVLNTDMKTDFVAVKVGDVNGNAIANDLMNNTESRTASSLSLSTENVEFTAGQTVTVPVNVSEMNTVLGMQFTLEFDSDLLSLTGVDPAGINVNDNNFGFSNIQNGVITVSWNAANTMKLNSNTTLFNLSFVAKDNGSLASAINITSDATKAEAYSEDAKVMPVSWRVNNAVSGFVLYQNTPNPFKETTNVSFELPEAMAATVTVYDVTGKVVTVANVDGVKGNNNVSFDRNDLRAGVMYYTLQAGAFKATKKMVVIE
jgi:hypothetical protein